MDDERAWRLASNEAVFRLVNERVKSVLHRQREPETTPTGFVCECGRMGCVATIYLTLEQYEAVRSHPARFALVPGHEIPKIETVVDRHDNFFVVEKIGPGRKAAVEKDPRS